MTTLHIPVYLCLSPCILVYMLDFSSTTANTSSTLEFISNGYLLHTTAISSPSSSAVPYTSYPSPTSSYLAYFSSFSYVCISPHSYRLPYKYPSIFKSCPLLHLLVLLWWYNWWDHWSTSGCGVDYHHCCHSNTPPEVGYPAVCIIHYHCPQM